MLYIDNPVGTGFSFTDSSNRGLSRDENQVADNLYKWVSASDPALIYLLLRPP